MKSAGLPTNVGLRPAEIVAGRQSIELHTFYRYFTCA